MKYKSIFLFIVFSISLIPLHNTAAEVTLKRELYSASRLMYFSDAVLGGDFTIEEAKKFPGLSSPVIDEDEEEKLSNAKMASMLHALKGERNDLDAQYTLSKAYLQGLGKDCEIEKLTEEYKWRKDYINKEIGILHKLRGDRRRWPTKLWHTIKRGGRGFWHKIGPGGRRFLRDMGPELMQIAATGGFGGVKTFVKNRLRALPKQQAKKLFMKGVERMIMGQIDLIKSAGIDICDPKKEEKAVKPTQTKIDESDILQDGTTWRCEEVNGFLEDRKAMQGADMKVLKSELDFTIQYINTEQGLHIKFNADSAEEVGVWQEDGSLGDWHVISAVYKAEAKNIDMDEYGVFQLHLSGNIHQTDGLLNYEGDKPFEANMYGLIPPESGFTRAFVCTPWANDIPAGLETLTGDNFADRCGYFYLYSCTKISK